MRERTLIRSNDKQNKVILSYGGAYRGVWQLFGHVHSCPDSTGEDTPRLNMLFPTQYDVGVDNNDFTPVSYEEVRSIILKRVEQSTLKSQ